MLLKKTIGLVVCIGWLGQLAAVESNYSNTIAHMTAYITNQMATENIVGLSIALVDGDTIVWARGFGYADREAGIPVGTGTVFRVGSVSKVFTTTAVLKLWEQGLVDLDAPVTNYIPEFAVLPRFPGATPITVRMLLDHQSGLPGDIYAGLDTSAPLPGFLDWLIAYLRGDYPAYPPLLVSVYCNTGFVLAEGIVRSATGMDFTAYTQTEVFDRLGMLSSSFLSDHPAVAANLAHPYMEGERMPDEYLGGYGTGGLYASMPDLIRYLRMVNAGGVLDGQRFMETNTLAEMTTDNSTNCPLNLNSCWLSGLGWDFVRYYKLDYAGRVWVKSGATACYTAYIIALPDQQLGVAVAVNSPSKNLFQTAQEALRYAVFEKSGIHWPTNTFVPPFSPVTNRPQTELDALVGSYVGNNGARLDRIIAGEGFLTWIMGADTVEPQVYSNLVPRANGWFSSNESQDFEITITNVSGTTETVLLMRSVEGPYQSTYVYGQRYQPTPISAAWSNRLGRVYLVRDYHPLEYFQGLSLNFTLRLTNRDGWLYHTSSFSEGYLDPQTDEVAFALGLQNRQPAAVRVLSTNGTEEIQCAGFHFVDAADCPVLAAGETRTGAISSISENIWQRLPLKQGLDYRAAIASAIGCAARVSEPNGTSIAWAVTGNAAVWHAESSSDHYLGVYGNGYTTGTFSITLTVLNHGGHDFDGDSKADPAIWQNGGLTIWFSSENYALPRSFALGDNPCAVLAADCDGDGEADPVAIDQRGVWIAWLSHSNYARAEIPLGTTSGTPLLADFDGDGKADPGLVENGQWYCAFSSDAYRVHGPFNLGLGNGLPAAADFDGDGKADPTVLNGTAWSARLSASQYATYTVDLGRAGVPCPGDFDGDGKADPALYANGWYLWPSSLNYQGCGPFLGNFTGTVVP